MFMSMIIFSFLHRVASFLHVPFLGHTGNSYRGLLHATDWLPTLYRAAGGDPEDLGPIDGIDQWLSLGKEEMPSKRSEMLYNIDPIRKNNTVKGAALR